MDVEAAKAFNKMPVGKQKAMVMPKMFDLLKEIGVKPERYQSFAGSFYQACKAAKKPKSDTESQIDGRPSEPVDGGLA